ncbi:hypothetical protein CHL78_012495 [Romboutsia weinsteinii]|uniref:Pilus assembly protein PilM n=1 Tax=Romboutsia weinsteinii TaxID=2020949 RepID=A0A371J1W9_9FIRM|nr:pilus assembly protein PilM [Romboutsia weinsteinii]RDY26658.1 hypothetical protein CHL78_012495 [Romboutsia weinsteinii]
MSKLYISYYGDFVSVVDGYYKKDKFIIDDVYFLSSDDIESNFTDKYNLLKHALKKNQSKAKSAVLCLNTQDVIVKSNKINKIDPKDLDSIMSMEIDEMISLEREEYTFSYEVIREFTEQGEDYLDLILAGLYTKEVETIIDIFTENNLKLECIDILPAAYSRVLKEIEYTDIMIVDTGDYSTAIEIYKEDSLYIHDNVPVRLGQNAQEYDYMRLVDEANGLMNYYSSRNFGKIVDTILIVGKYAHNEEVRRNFSKLFGSEIIPGIENLYDIYTDIKGDIQSNELNMIVETIGCMLREVKKHQYYRMNLLPTEMKKQEERNKQLLKTLKVIPIVLVILYIPILSLTMMKKLTDDKLNEVNSHIEQIKEDHKQISDIDNKIRLKQEEIEIYDMLIKKEPRWGDILTSIDKNIPYKVFLENLSLSYVPQESNVQESTDNSGNADITSDNGQNQTEDSSSENKETPIYDKIPNLIIMSGTVATPSDAGKFVYNLKSLPYFEEVKFPGITEKVSGDEKNKKTSYSFSITAKLKEGIVTNE